VSADTPAEPFRILVVCTGNICRSPVAEALLRSALGRVAAASGDSGWLAIEVSSGGTMAMVGRPIEPAMAAALGATELEASGHVASQVDRDRIAGADLVLGLAREHRRDLVAMLPSASRRIFTLGEFARLLEDAADAGTIELADGATSVIAAAADAAAMRRGFAIAPDDPTVDDVIDPYGRSPDVYASSASTIQELVHRIERVLLTQVVAA